MLSDNPKGFGKPNWLWRQSSSVLPSEEAPSCLRRSKNEKEEIRMRCSSNSSANWIKNWTTKSLRTWSSSSGRLWQDFELSSRVRLLLISAPPSDEQVSVDCAVTSSLERWNSVAALLIANLLVCSQIPLLDGFEEILDFLVLQRWHYDKFYARSRLSQNVQPALDGYWTLPSFAGHSYPRFLRNSHAIDSYPRFLRNSYAIAPHYDHRF